MQLKDQAVRAEAAIKEQYKNSVAVYQQQRGRASHTNLLATLTGNDAYSNTGDNDVLNMLGIPMHNEPNYAGTSDAMAMMAAASPGYSRPGYGSPFKTDASLPNVTVFQCQTGQ